ncbi:MAG: LuxR C-terminal-related transcriptional regulator [Treponema sp.]|nr:LuxR C-terminal-related transcriptional regulator [Treponema sp.]
MENAQNRSDDSRNPYYFWRPRLNSLFMEAVKYPVVVICAGAGYGKTSAVHDFLNSYETSKSWIQLSERDNIRSRLWENYINNMTKENKPLAKAIGELGFPDTKDKKNQYLYLWHKYIETKRRVIVLDDFHLIEDPSIIRFFNECVIFKLPPGTSLFLISRCTPSVNITALETKNQVFKINEDSLRFTESELSQYFRILHQSFPRSQNIPPGPESLREIMKDTGGWAFAINIIARSYQKAPGYGGYLRNAMKTNIFQLMEAQDWDELSKRLQSFLIQLSLIDHLAIELIALLAMGDEELIAELEKQNAYVRRDNYINAYLIHPLYLEFLASKQGTLSEEQKQKTYNIAGDWCKKNGYFLDALAYFEINKDYNSIASVFPDLPVQIPPDIAKYTAAILERAPAKVFETTGYLAAIHLRSYVSQGQIKKAIELAEFYEAKYLELPEHSEIKNTLAGIYYSWARMRFAKGLTDDIYDFDKYFEKLSKCFPTPVDPGNYISPSPGAWICIVGSERKGAPEEFIAALKRTVAHLSNCFIDFDTGHADLALGELKYYQGDISSAENLFASALKRTPEKGQTEFVHRALFYTLRIAVLQGNYSKARQILNKLKTLRDENDYSNRFTNYDISLSWYFYILEMPENMPDWLQDDFSPYHHATFKENFANQIKARFCYKSRNYTPLLSYIQEMKQRESFLFQRVEMLAIEACVHYRKKNKDKSFAALLEAYKASESNNLIMPFIELGKDMRTLTAAALKEFRDSIPVTWLENINQKASSYAKSQTNIIIEYNQQAIEKKGIFNLSPREKEILNDLSNGLSRTEIASSHNLSINTVKTTINMIYTKTGAKNLPNLIRIAMEQKLI